MGGDREETVSISGLSLTYYRLRRQALLNGPLPLGLKVGCLSGGKDEE